MAAPSLPWLDETSFEFPDPSAALLDPNGLLAVGGDLNWQRLLLAYQNGIFPWYTEPPILWWSPDPRCVIFPEHINISRSMKKFLKSHSYRISIDEAFREVIEHCAQSRDDEEGSWITPEMMAAYTQLHEHGHAHSFEVWEGEHLVGGLYGIGLKRVFSGESMFSLESNTSKLALIALAQHCLDNDIGLIDCQVANPHLYSMGACDIARDDYLRVLRAT